MYPKLRFVVCLHFQEIDFPAGSAAAVQPQIHQGIHMRHFCISIPEGVLALKLLLNLQYFYLSRARRALSLRLFLVVRHLSIAFCLTTKEFNVCVTSSLSKATTKTKKRHRSIGCAPLEASCRSPQSRSPASSSSPSRKREG